MMYNTRLRLKWLRNVSIAGLLIAGTSALAQGPPPPPPPVPDVPVPAENPITLEKKILGKILFWDEQLSSDNTMSCGTCHIPGFAGADPRQGIHPGFDGIFSTADDIVGSPGVVHRDINGDPVNDSVFGFAPQVTSRSAPSYFASMFADENFWDGRASSTFVDPEDEVTVVIASGGGLESQAVGPIMSGGEMAKDGRTWDDVRTKLSTAIPMLLASNVPEDVALFLNFLPTYPALFESAFGTPAITASRIGMAIATYERTLVADETPWDAFNDGDMGALTQNQLNGLDIMIQEQCTNCHVPPLFTDNNFHNIGLRPSEEDIGREDITGNAQDTGHFKTPSLRNVGLKGSLMHVGWLTDLDDALDFYDQANGHVQFTADQSDIPDGGNYDNINLNGGEKDDIVDFLLNGLTDPRVAAETFPFDRPTLYSEMALSPEIHVDFDFIGMEDGSETKPYDSLAEAIVHVASSGTLVLQAGNTGESLTLNQPMTLTAPSGTAMIGATP